MIENLKDITEKFRQNGIKVIVVGGYVRDRLLNQDSKDIDLELYNADSLEKVKEILREFGSVNEVGSSFGVLKLNYEGLELDLSLPRSEKKISRGHGGFDVTCRADMSYEEAFKRRDFTINAIGYDMELGRYIDPYGGMEDLQNKRLHYVNKESFVEDPLRLFRAMQFSARFSLHVSDELLELLKEMVDKKMLQELSRERIFIEFEKLFLKAKKPSIGLELLKKINIEKSYPFFSDIFKVDLKLFDLVQKKELKIYFTLMLYYCKELKKSLEFFTNEKQLIKDVVNLQRETLHVEHNELSDFEIKKMALHVELDDVDELLRVKKIKREFSKKIDEFGIRHKAIEPLIMGADLISLGLKPSVRFKEILDNCYDEQLKRGSTCKEEMLDFALKLTL